MKILMRPVDMIAWFTKEGRPNPVKYKVTNADGNIIIKVDKIITAKEEKPAGNRMYVFKCQSLVNGIERLYELKYELNTCRWFLYKM